MLVAAVGARAVDVAVGQEPLGLGIVRLAHRLAVEVSVLAEGQEHVVGDGGMVVRSRGREQIEADAEVAPVAEELGVVAVDDLLRGHTLFVRPDRDRGAVHVGAGHHQHVVAGQAVIAGEDVRGEIGACDVPEMQGPLRIGPGNGDEDLAWGVLAAQVGGWYQWTCARTVAGTLPNAVCDRAFHVAKVRKDR